MTDAIVYERNEAIAPAEFVDLLNRSTLAERRPVNDPDVIAGMLKNADLTVIARHAGKIVGVSRSVTDFHYCCYLSDLAVDRDYQKRGIGTELIRRSREFLGPKCTVILLSAPAAEAYYPKIGFEPHNSAWVLRPGRDLS